MSEEGVMGMAGEVSLWDDWCSATGRDPSVVTPAVLTEHLIQCPAPTRRARRDRLRAVLDRAGSSAAARASVLGAPAAPDSPFRAGPGWLGVDDTLAGIDPDDVAGRRDAFMMVLVGHVGLSRARVVGLAPDQVAVPDERRGGWPCITGVDVPFHRDPGRCACCVVHRWVRTLAAYQDGGRAAVREDIVADSHLGHVCSEPVRSVWASAPVLVPSIDRHGWFGEALTVRSVSAITARRQEDVSVAAPPPLGEGEEPRRGASEWMGCRPAPDPSLDDALDRLERALDVAAARAASLAGAAEGGGSAGVR